MTIWNNWIILCRSSLIHSMNISCINRYWRACLYIGMLGTANFIFVPSNVSNSLIIFYICIVENINLYGFFGPETLAGVHRTTQHNRMNIFETVGRTNIQTYIFIYIDYNHIFVLIQNLDQYHFFFIAKIKFPYWIR